jgi:hypothetical protein
MGREREGEQWGGVGWWSVTVILQVCVAEERRDIYVYFWRGRGEDETIIQY